MTTISKTKPGTPRNPARGSTVANTMGADMTKNTSTLRTPTTPAPLPGWWVEYAAHERVRGVRVPAGRRFGMVAEVRGRVVRLVDNGPVPKVVRVPLEDVGAPYRLIRCSEIAARRAYCREYGCPARTVKTLRQVDDARRVARKGG